MKPSSIENKIARLEEEVSSLKSSQILGGENTRVYHRYIEGESVWVRVGMNEYQPDTVWFSEDGSSGSTQGGISFCALYDDPFELVEVEKVEIWRNGFLLSGWSGMQYYSTRGYGQRSSTGDLIRMSISRSHYTWQTGTLTSATKRLGPLVIFNMSGGQRGDFSNVSYPFRYTFKLWLKTTSTSEYMLHSR